MMEFQTMSDAREYVREMSTADTEAIGDHEVWRLGSGLIVVLEPGERVDEEYNATLVGTVTWVLC